MRLWIRNGTLVNPQGRSGRLELLIEEDRIAQIAEPGEIEKSLSGSEEDIRIIDAAGCIAAPGLVDVHVHFRDPGQLWKEDIETGAAAAAHGGYTSVVMMANTVPTIDNEETLRYVLEKGERSGIRVYACANVTKGMQGRELTEMDALRAAGAVGFTDDGKPLMDAELVREAMVRTAGLGVPISFHEEDPAYIQTAGYHKGKASEHYGIGGADREAEITMIRRDIALALETGAEIDIQHISTAEGVELVRQGRRSGQNIHAEATPHHFTLTEEAAIRYGTMAKMNPPLRTEEDRQAILEGLRDGTIEMIATDHAPHSAEEKAKGITEAPSGIIGLETALALANEILVDGGYLTQEQLIERMSCAPARIYHLADAGCLREGGAADIVIYAPGERWIAGDYASRSANTPFTGREMKGRVRYTICRGAVVYAREEAAATAR